MCTNKLTMITKLNAIEEWARTNILKGTAKKFNIYPYQIRQCIKNKDKTKNLAEISPQK